MLLEELKYTSLRTLVTAVRHIPKFCLKSVAGTLAVPSVTHHFECLFDTRNREEYVL